MYKVGDKVKVIGNDGGNLRHYFDIGDTVKVTGVHDDFLHCEDGIIKQYIHINNVEKETDREI
ncbi:hypothetical protein [Paenibacillus sp. OV219]|uniref:hypothetical protein n=1 Tax=Paenibacillus sp. OV219 TaxID=1884377 RepID=UPI0008AEA2F5|nr:hypothetical protein [Paenibacillus sp. OV219]SEN20458.1 hypothetical protein SAMN05518847_102408 [Paenibacillus sp. OV219]